MLGIHQIETLAPTYEPSIVRRMAQELGAEEAGNGKWPFILMLAAGAALAVAYWDCYRRGYCGSMTHQYQTRGRRA